MSGSGIAWPRGRRGRRDPPAAPGSADSLPAGEALRAAKSPGLVRRRAYRELGRYEEAITDFLALHQRTGGPPPSGLAVTYARMGREAEARTILREWEANTDEPGAELSIAVILVALGDFDAAMEWLERASELRSHGIFSVGADPGFDPIANDPRFRGLLRRLGLTDSQLDGRHP